MVDKTQPARELTGGDNVTKTGDDPPIVPVFRWQQLGYGATETYAHQVNGLGVLVRVVEKFGRRRTTSSTEWIPGVFINEDSQLEKISVVDDKT